MTDKHTLSDELDFDVEAGDTEDTEDIENTEEKRITLDPRRWSYQDYSDFLTYVSRGDWEQAMPLIMRIVVSWDYDVPLAPNAYEDLPFPALRAIALTVRETLSAYQENVDIRDVRVDMSRWKMKDFFKFREAAKKGDVETLETMMKKVVRMKGVTPSKRLTFEQGVKITQAINKATGEMFGSGN